MNARRLAPRARLARRRASPPLRRTPGPSGSGSSTPPRAAPSSGGASPGRPPSSRPAPSRSSLRAPHPTLYTSKVLGLAEPLSTSVPERLKKAAPVPARPRPGRRGAPDAGRPTSRTPRSSSGRRSRTSSPGAPSAVVCSLGAFDGGTRPVEGAEMLLFGPDVIAGHPAARLQPPALPGARAVPRAPRRTSTRTPRRPSARRSGRKGWPPT